MTPEVVAVQPDTPLAEVAEVMGRRGVSGVPVVDADGKVVGVISEKDFLTHLGVKEAKNFMTLVAGCLKTKGCVALPIKAPAADLMSSPAVTVARTPRSRRLPPCSPKRPSTGWRSPTPTAVSWVWSPGGISSRPPWGGERMIGAYFRKMTGTTQSPPRVGLAEILWSWLGAFLGIGLVAYINYGWLEGTDLVLLIGSLGASAVLIYGAIKSPLAQPRNFLGGHIISALIGVTAFKLLAPHLWLAAALAVATSIAVMHATKTLHPPGGATALIAVIGGPKIHQPGLPLRPDARGRRRPHHAGGGPAGQQPGPPAPLPGVLVVKITGGVP